MSRTDQSPATGPVLSLRKAIYRAAHDYRGGVTALALDMVLDYDSLQKKVKHDEERRWLDPDEMEEVIRLTADPCLLDALVRPAGAVWYKPIPVPATADALKAVGKMLEESGQFVACMHDGAADNIWEPHEVLLLEQRGMDVIREVLGIMAGARKAMEALTMSDDIDIANDAAEHFRQLALASRPRPTCSLSAQFCEDCDEPIPLLRQQTIQGCATCVSCQGLRERRR